MLRHLAERHYRDLAPRDAAAVFSFTTRTEAGAPLCSLQLLSEQHQPGFHHRSNLVEIVVAPGWIKLFAGWGDHRKIASPEQSVVTVARCPTEPSVFRIREFVDRGEIVEEVPGVEESAALDPLSHRTPAPVTDAIEVV